jgi:hypothetical protein
MSISNKPISSITETDLTELIVNQVAEGKTIDYKLTLPGNSDDDKKEFLADVSSFANTAGGHLIFGMEETQGIASNLPGISGLDPDKEKLRLEEIIRNGIAPRIAGISIHAVQLQNGNCVIATYIPKSWSSPHMVTFKGASRFFARHSAGKYPMDVQEIRQSFLLSDSTAERIKSFRLERLSQIRAGETPVAMSDEAKMVLHFVPLSSFQSFETIDIHIISENFSEYFNKLHYRKFNLDGLLLYESRTDTQAQSYLQLFRHGHFEFVNGYIAYPLGNSTRWAISGTETERDIMDLSARIFSCLKRLEIEPPLFLFLSFIKVGKHTLDNLQQLEWRTAGKYDLDRDNILIPELMVNDFPPDKDAIAKLLRPTFDMLWNAFGAERSWNYDENGDWHPRR